MARARTPAWDVAGALKKARADKFGIILLDYYLPDGNGVTAAGRNCAKWSFRSDANGMIP